MNIPWQIQRDLSRARLDDTVRAARYAPHLAGSHRRPMLRVAAVVRRASDRVSSLVPRRVVPATRDHNLDAGRTDLRITVAPID